MPKSLDQDSSLPSDGLGLGELEWWDPNKVVILRLSLLCFSRGGGPHVVHVSKTSTICDSLGFFISKTPTPTQSLTGANPDEFCKSFNTDLVPLSHSFLTSKPNGRVAYQPLTSLCSKPS